MKLGLSVMTLTVSVLTLAGCNSHRSRSQKTDPAPPTSQNSTPATPTGQTNTPAAPAGQAANLTGQWQRCEPGKVPAQSIKTVYEFQADGKFTVKTSAYADTQCTQVWKQSDIDAYVKSVKTDTKKEGEIVSEQDVKEIYDRLSDKSENGTYKTSKQLTDGAIEIDMTFQGGSTDYSVYKIEGDSLFFAEVCSARAKEKWHGFCMTASYNTGTKPEYRATLLNKTNPLIKVK